VTDNETLIRDRLASAATFHVVTDPGRVHEGVARRRRRIRRRRRGAAVVMALAVAVFGGAGVVLALNRDTQPNSSVQVGASDQTPASSEVPGSSEVPSSSAVPDESRVPQFLPARGWEVVQKETSAVASNIPLGPMSRSGSAPWDTVERLGRGDVVLYAISVPTGESAAVDAAFPAGELPLSLDHAQPGGLEGNPGVGLTLRMRVQVNGWNIDLLVFYGAAEPSAETRAVAQEQLARLDVPSR
jgi:hypothetical protein